MSILIKDMKMPERCLECPFYDNYNYYCILYSFGIPVRYNRDGSTRPEWCEIKELPEGRAMCDSIDRQAAIDAPEKLIKDCNPEHFVGHQKFIEFMDNAEIGSFGNWQFTNGFNMGLTAAEVEIKNLPSAQPVIRCKDCKWKQGSECVRFADVRPFDDDFCSRAERRTDEYKICNGVPFAETN